MCHVLIIEDELLIALDIQAVLEEHGATSFAFAVSEAEAVEIAHLQRPDFITSDFTLLEGTGPRAVERIRSVQGPIPVIYITSVPDVCKACEQPMRLLAKPFQSLSIAVAFRELAPLCDQSASFSS